MSRPSFGATRAGSLRSWMIGGRSRRPAAARGAPFPVGRSSVTSFSAATRLSTPEARTASADDWMPIEHWRHDAPAAPATVVAIHGFTMGDPVRGATSAHGAPSGSRSGVDVVLVTLPLPRRAHARDSALLGRALRLEWHVGRLNEAVRRIDSRSPPRHDSGSRSRSNAPIGMIGMSLGAMSHAPHGRGRERSRLRPSRSRPRSDSGRFRRRSTYHSRYAKRMPPPLAVGELDEAYQCALSAHLPALPAARARHARRRTRRSHRQPPEHALFPLASIGGCPGDPLEYERQPMLTPFRRAAVFAAGARRVPAPLAFAIVVVSRPAAEAAGVSVLIFVPLLLRRRRAVAASTRVIRLDSVSSSTGRILFLDASWRRSRREGRSRRPERRRQVHHLPHDRQRGGARRRTACSIEKRRQRSATSARTSAR